MARLRLARRTSGIGLKNEVFTTCETNGFLFQGKTTPLLLSVSNRKYPRERTVSLNLTNPCQWYYGIVVSKEKNILGLFVSPLPPIFLISSWNVLMLK